MARVPASMSESQPLCISWKSALLPPACPDKVSVLSSCQSSLPRPPHCRMGPLWIDLLPMALAFHLGLVNHLLPWRILCGEGPGSGALQDAQKLDVCLTPVTQTLKHSKI